MLFYVFLNSFMFFFFFPPADLATSSIEIRREAPEAPKPGSSQLAQAQTLPATTMSDSEGSLQIRRPPNPGTSIATAAHFASLSDDDSDDGRVHARDSRPSPSPRSRSRSRSPSQAQDREQSPRRPSPPRRSISPPVTLQKTAGTWGARQEAVDLVHFPPNISLRGAVTTNLEKLPQEQNPILYRLKPGVKKSKSTAETVMDLIKTKGHDPLALAEVLQSNANLITWSDGSRTLAVGSTQFLLIEDAVASKHVLFRENHEDLLTFEARVNKVARVQPSSTSDARTKLAMATAAMKAISKRPEGRTMLRCMDESGELEEAKAKMESLRRERERARLEARRRQARERNVRPNRTLTVDHLESDDESQEDQVRKMEERFDAERLMRAKRAAPPRPREAQIKRRKAGGRRVLGSDEDESDEDD